MLHESISCPILLSSNYLLCECSIVCLPSSVEGHLGHFQFWLSMNEAAIYNCIQVDVSVHLDKYLRVVLMLRVYFTLNETAKLFFKVVVLFDILASNTQKFQLFCIFVYTWFCWFLNFSHPNTCVVCGFRC